MKDFITKVLNKRNLFQVETLSYKNIVKVQEMVLDSLNLKNLNELRDKFEGVAFIENFSLKIYGIIAIENLLKQELIDWTKINPKDYDPIIFISNQKINVIMSDYGEFPIIDKKSDIPAIITIKRGEKDVWICGFADIETLNKYQNESLLKGSMIKNIDSKTAFVGFEYLKPFKSIEDLKNII